VYFTILNIKVSCDRTYEKSKADFIWKGGRWDVIPGS